MSVGTAAGVASAVGGIASAAGTVYAASQAQSGPSGSPQDLYGSKIQIPDYPPYDPGAGLEDINTILPGLVNLATDVTKANRVLRNRIMPESGKILKQAGTNLLQMGRGYVPSDVVDETNRLVAERTGGSFDPASPGSFGGAGSVTQNDFARNIGQTSQDQVNKFLSVAPTWEQLTDSFTYKVQDAMGAAMEFLKMRYQANQDQYIADLNAAKAAAAPDPQAVGAANDALIQQSYQQQSGTGPAGGFQTEIKGVLGGLNGLFSGLQSFRQPSATAGTFMGTGGSYGLPNASLPVYRAIPA